MNRLELKHIAPYLPYGLKVLRDSNTEKDISEIDGLFINGAIHLKKTNRIDYFHFFPYIKPILLPLSKLSIEEKIVIGRILYGDNTLHKAFAVDSAESWIRKGMRPVMSLQTALDVTEYLFSIHADVFNLVEQGLAIDKDTLTK